MDRKALIAAYRNTPRPMGVYAVRNLHDGRLLVGRSVDLPSILNRERAQLRLRCHGNVALQADWNRLGEQAFAFETLDTITAPPDTPGYDPKPDLEALEAMWLDRLQPFGARGYNPRPKARP